jgi:hypothetical protein
MNKTAASLFAGLPIVAFACAGCGSEQDHPSPCASGWTSCPNSQFCVAPGGKCPKGDGLDGAVLLPDGSDRGPIVAGDGGLCDGNPQGALGTKITLNVRWPGTAARNRGSGTLSLWLLLRYAVDGSGGIAGTVETCGMQMPTFVYNTGDNGPVLPQPTAQVQITIPAGSWDGTPTTPITGARGGSRIGSTFAIDPVVTLFGLERASALDNAAQAWPPSVTDLVATDLTYADGGAYQPGVGEPGILAIPTSDMPWALPATSLRMSSPHVDELWLALRTQLSLQGSVLSCTKLAGTAVAGRLDTHVVGCHVIDGGPCTADQYVFVDDNRSTDFLSVPADGSFQAMPMVDAGCKDVLAKFP